MTDFMPEQNTKEQARRKVNRNKLTLLITMLLLVVVLSTACIYYFIQYHMLTSEVEQAVNEIVVLEEELQKEHELVEEATDTEEVVDGRADLLAEMKALLLDGYSSIGTIRKVFTEDVLFVDADGYNFYPIDDTLPQHGYEDEQFVLNEKDRLEYVVDGEVISKTGIDLATFQGNVDWDKVAADGIDFAIVRAGARGYGTGKLIVDEQFHNNMKGAIEAGVEVGVYFYTQAISEAEAREEAMLVIEELAPYKEHVTWPVVIDVEDPDYEDARTNHLTQEERTDYTIEFLTLIEEEGYEPMIYGNMKSFLKMLDMYRIGAYEKWYANYNENVYFPYELSIWQYTDSGKVDGINTNVDMNIAFR